MSDRDEGNTSGSESEGEGGGLDMDDMFAGMMCAESDGEGEDGGAADGGDGGDGEEEGDEEEEDEMSQDEKAKTDLGTLLQEFSLDFKHFSALVDCGGGHSYAHIARGGDRGIMKVGIPTLKARKLWKTAVTRAKEKEQATDMFKPTETE